MLSALCYGSLNPDLVHRIAEFPTPGADLRSVDAKITYGGGGANAAVALAAWGASTTVVGNTLGEDPLGRWLIEDLAARGVDVSLIEVSALARTPHCIVLVGADAERTIVSTGYADSPWQPVAPDVWTGKSVAVVDAYSALAGTAVIRQALDAGVPAVGVDVTGRAAAPLRACVWSGDEHRMEDALALSRSGPDVVLTGGSEDVAWCRQGEVLLTNRPPAVDAVDPTGAGDTLAAMIAFGIGSQWETAHTLRMAVAAASLSVGLERGEPIPDLGSITKLAQTMNG